MTYYGVIRLFLSPCSADSAGLYCLKGRADRRQIAAIGPRAVPPGIEVEYGLS